MYNAAGQIERTQTVKAHLPLVRRQALALQVRLPASVQLDDLMQAGMVGLLEALDRYEAGQGASFETFAAQRVRGAMVDELRRGDWLPRSVRRNARELTRTIERLEQRLGRAPTGSEIAKAMGLALDDYHALLGDINNGLILSFSEDDSDDRRDRPLRGAGRRRAPARPDRRHRGAARARAHAAGAVLPGRAQPQGNRRGAGRERVARLANPQPGHGASAQGAGGARLIPLRARNDE